MSISTSGTLAASSGLRPKARDSYAVVLYFDEATEARVREMWAALDRDGVTSVGTTHGITYRPHLTLAIVKSERPLEVAGNLWKSLRDVAGLPLTLGSLGFFLTERAPAYLAATPTSGLVAVHEEVHAALDGTDNWDYYRPGTWMPHCTLAMDVAQPSVVTKALSSATLPVKGSVSAAHLVQLPAPASAPSPAVALDTRLSLAPYAAVPAQHRSGPRHRGDRRILASFAPT